MTYDDAAAMLALVKSGTPIRDLTDRKGAPFSQWLYRKYAAANPAFHKEVLAASKANEKAKKSANGQRRFADQTHCKQGHAYTGDNVGVKNSRGNPSRFCRQCSREAARRVRPMTAEQVQKVKRLVTQGVAMGRMFHGGALHVTGYKNIAHQRAIDPAFDRMMAEHASKGHVRAVRTRAMTRQREQANDYRAIRAMVPRWMPPDAADDIAQGVMLSLIDRSARRDQIPERIRVLVADYRRGFKFGRNQMLSLDGALYADGTGSFHDLITDGLWN